MTGSQAFRARARRELFTRICHPGGTVPERARLAARAERAHPWAAGIVAELDARDQPARPRAGEYRVGQNRLVDRVLRVEHELSE